MAERILVLGGARSGKSSWAEELAGRGRPVTYVATSPVTDAEMAERIARHRADRPPLWTTIEEEFAPMSRLTGAEEVVLLDCVSLLVTNHLLRSEVGAEESVRLALSRLLQHPGRLILVSNEVGMGVVPPYPLGRLFRDVLGRTNQFLAAACDRVYVCWAGIPVEVKGLDARRRTPKTLGD
jgi:adenosylcobinamide kinase/adenosylcobinamide-phosphate guanylyltransferase